MELITQNLAAGQAMSFRRGGVYFELISADYPLSAINFLSSQGGQINSIKTPLSGFFCGFPFGAFDLVNGSTAQTVQVLVADAGESGGSRRQPGNVRIIDNSADKTLSGVSFSYYANQQGVAAQFSAVGLLAGAGKLVKVKKATLTVPTATPVFLLSGTGQGTANPTISALKNRYLGQAGSVSVTTAGTATAFPPLGSEVPGASICGAYMPAAGVPFDIPMSSPILIDPGKAMLLMANTANCQVFANFEIEE